MVRTLNDPSLDEHERKAVEDVSRHGLHVVRVLPEGGTPGWAFSIGLWENYQHPEVVVFGLTPEVAHHLLNQVAEVVRIGGKFEPGSEYDDLLEGIRCTFKPVQSLWYHPFLGWADWFYEDSDYPVLQCIWPDHDQRYPWDPAFRADWVWAQPLLFHANLYDARATELIESLGLLRNPEA
jgi:hypothetical protein